MKRFIAAFMLLILPLYSSAQSSTSTWERVNMVNAEVMFLFPVISYERYFPVSEKFAFTAKAGLTYFDGALPLTEAGIVWGNARHKGSLTGFAVPFSDEFGFGLGYKRQLSGHWGLSAGALIWSQHSNWNWDWNQGLSWNLEQHFAVFPRIGISYTL